MAIGTKPWQSSRKSGGGLGHRMEGRLARDMNVMLNALGYSSKSYTPIEEHF